jgi:hypothetical protein
VVIASDARDSFVAFLYPEDGLTWIRGDGKAVPVKVDVPAQAGFDAGDNSRYYRLPGSGNPEVLQLSEYVIVEFDFFSCVVLHQLLYSAIAFYVRISRRVLDTCQVLDNGTVPALSRFALPIAVTGARSERKI